MEQSIATIDGLLDKTKLNNKDDYVTAFKKADAIIEQPIFDKINFKKAFNAFADNIYYSDPDRANLYLGGGAIPKPTQSLAYLLRNDVLTNVEDLRAELTYLMKELNRGGAGEGGVELDDLYSIVKMAKEGMVKYLDLVPPKELEAARASFKP